MILVTAFRQDKNPTVTIAQADPENAAKVAISLAHSLPFIRIEDGAWRIVFPAHCRVSKARLAHIIEHRAEVEFA